MECFLVYPKKKSVTSFPGPIRKIVDGYLVRPGVHEPPMVAKERQTSIDML